jgi:uncharacterized protein DUF4145
MPETEKIEQSYCQRCGGDRQHTVVATKHGYWSNEDAAIDGSDTWSIVECRGCGNVTFVHEHWFSEDTEPDGRPIHYRDLYPPPPPRSKPEWASAMLWRALSREDQWLAKLYDDIYSALATEAFSLTAMGIRTIVDFVVTSQAGDTGSFAKKLKRVRAAGLITETQQEILSAAFDVGSAAAHRGYSPARKDVHTLLDIAEALLRQVYIEPMLQRDHAEAATELKKKTPPAAAQRFPKNACYGTGSIIPAIHSLSFRSGIDPG